MMYIQKLFRSSVLRFAPKVLIPPFHYRKVTSFIGTTTGSLAAEIRTFAERYWQSRSRLSRQETEAQTCC